MSKYNFFDKGDYSSYVDDQLKDLIRENHGTVSDLWSELRRGQLEQEIEEEINKPKW